MKKKMPLIARILLGLVFLAAGIAGFATGFAYPPDLPPQLLTFNQGMAASVYFMPFVKGVEILCGLALLSGFFVPLALVVLAAVLLNILLVNIFMMPTGIPMAAVLIALEIYLAFFTPYSGPIKALFRKK